VYATVPDLRAEGFTAEEVADDRASRALEEASALIDVLTGQFFEPRAHTFIVEGRGAPSLWLRVPILRIDELIVAGAGWPLELRDLVVVSAPVMPGTDGPRITRVNGVFPKGLPVAVEGLWGYTEPDGTRMGRTPLAIRRACLLLATRFIPRLADDGSLEARLRSRIVEERTRDQSYRVGDPPGSIPVLTGDAEIDALLAPYVRRPQVGAA